MTYIRPIPKLPFASYCRDIQQSNAKCAGCPVKFLGVNRLQTQEYLSGFRQGLAYRHRIIELDGNQEAMPATDLASQWT